MDQFKHKGLYSLFYRRLKEVESKSDRDFIPLPLLFQKLCRNFSMTKHDCWQVLKILNENSLIEFIGCRGIRLKPLSHQNQSCLLKEVLCIL